MKHDIRIWIEKIISFYTAVKKASWPEFQSPSKLWKRIEFFHFSSFFFIRFNRRLQQRSWFTEETNNYLWNYSSFCFKLWKRKLDHSICVRYSLKPAHSIRFHSSNCWLTNQPKQNCQLNYSDGGTNWYLNFTLTTQRGWATGANSVNYLAKIT